MSMQPNYCSTCNVIGAPQNHADHNESMNLQLVQRRLNSWKPQITEEVEPHSQNLINKQTPTSSAVVGTRLDRNTTSNGPWNPQSLATSGHQFMLHDKEGNIQVHATLDPTYDTYPHPDSYSYDDLVDSHAGNNNGQLPLFISKHHPPVLDYLASNPEHKHLVPSLLGHIAEFSLGRYGVLPTPSKNLSPYSHNLVKQIAPHIGFTGDKTIEPREYNDWDFNEAKDSLSRQSDRMAELRKTLKKPSRYSTGDRVDPDNYDDWDVLDEHHVVDDNQKILGPRYNAQGITSEHMAEGRKVIKTILMEKAAEKQAKAGSYRRAEFEQQQLPLFFGHEGERPNPFSKLRAENG